MLCLNTAFSFLTTCMPKLAIIPLKNIKASDIPQSYGNSFIYLTANFRVAQSLPMYFPTVENIWHKRNRIDNKVIFHIETDYWSVRAEMSGSIMKILFSRDIWKAWKHAARVKSVRPRPWFCDFHSALRSIDTKNIHTMLTRMHISAVIWYQLYVLFNRRIAQREKPAEIGRASALVIIDILGSAIESPKMNSSCSVKSHRAGYMNWRKRISVA